MFRLVLLIIILTSIADCAHGQDVPDSDEEPKGKSHDYFHVQRVPGDRLLSKTLVRVKGLVFNHKKYDLVYPPTWDTYDGAITRIEVFDQRTDGKGGSVEIIEGGIAATSVKLHFKSQRGHGINFFVKIYGKPT